MFSYDDPYFGSIGFRLRFAAVRLSLLHGIPVLGTAHADWLGAAVMIPV